LSFPQKVYGLIKNAIIIGEKKNKGKGKENSGSKDS